MKRTAVITDATSAEFFFPRWRRYYGGLFGFENLHVVTYGGMRALFQDAGIGNVWQVNEPYSDDLRVYVIVDLIKTLLNSYDVVIRCDVDEFIVPDPSICANLAEFIEMNEAPYVTAHGIDVIEVEEDSPLDAELPVLCVQRRYARRAAAVGKTCLTTVPLGWSRGFHAASVIPHFAGLYNFHLKFADLKNRIQWHDRMREGLVPGSIAHGYFAIDAEHFAAIQGGIAAMARTGEETEREFEERFLKSVTYNPAPFHIYQGDFIAQDFLFHIDGKFGGMI
jgi:hypothetical protein